MNESNHKFSSNLLKHTLQVNTYHNLTILQNMTHTTNPVPKKLKIQQMSRKNAKKNLFKNNFESTSYILKGTQNIQKLGHLKFKTVYT